MIFKQINSSVDETRKTLALFNKDWNTYKSNWQNANGLFGKIGSIFSSSKGTSNNIISNDQLQILRNWNNAVKHGCTNQETFNRIIADADENTKMYFAGLNKGKGSVEGLKNAQNAAETSTISLTIAQTALNTAINMGIGLAISYAIKGISKLINYQKELIDKSQEAISVFEESRDALTNNKQTIDEISSDYTRLAQGVDSLGRNVSLNTEEYTRYNEIVNQIADMFPQMVQGYTDEGNAIIINKGNVEELTKAYEEQKKAYQDLVITKSADTFAGYKAKVAETPWTESLKGKNGTYAYIEQKKYIDELIKSLEDGEQAFEDFYSNQYIKNSDIYSVLNSATKTAGIDWGGVMDTDKRYEQMKSQMTKLYAYQRQLVSNINTETSKIKPIMSAYMEQSYDYQSLDSDVQDVVKQIVEQFDSEFYTQFDNETDMATWVTENVVNKFKGIDGEKITEAFKNSIDLKTKLQNGEISLDDYLSGINEFKTLIDGFDDNTKKSVDLIFNVNSSNGLSTDTLVNNVKEKLQDDFDDKVGELTLEELHIAAEQIEVPDEDLLSWDELIAKIEEAKNLATDDEPKNLFTALTTSEESLDKFQSSIKSAADAYATLLSGNYSSSELLDSIQAINQAVTDMGGSLNWEYIASQSVMDPLELLGKAIENVSRKYAESVLSGAGINVNSEFDQMLANIIQEAYEAEAAFEGMNSQLDNLQSSYQTLTGILESYNETGYISLDNLQSLLTADENLITMLEVENGQLAINQEAYENLVVAQLMEFKAKLNDAAAAEIETLAKNKAEEATNKNADASQNAVEKLDAETQAFNRNTSAAISNAIAKAEESGVSEEEIQSVLDKYNEVWNATVSNFSGDFDGFMGGTKSASNAGSAAGDAYVDAFEKEYDHLKDLLNRGEISEAQYLNRLRALYTRYFKDRKEYLDEYKKYESEYLSGMLDLHNKALSGISTLLNRKISAANDAKDAAISALEEEKDAAAEAYQAQIDAIEEEKDAIDDLIDEKNKKIDAINEEIDAIERAAETRKKNIQLEKDQYALEKMLNQRTTSVYKEGVGFVFEADTTGIRDAREKVKEDQEALQIDGLKNEISLIQKEIDLLEEKKDALTEQQEAIQKMLDESNKYYDNLIKQQEKMWDSMIKGMEQQKSKWEELADIQQIAEAYSAVQQVFGELGYSVEEVLNGSESAFEDFKSKYISIMSDMNQNTSFQEGLEYASGVAKENFGSIVSDAQDTVQQLSQTFSDGTFSQAIAQGVSDGIVSAQQELDKMNQLGNDAGDGFIEGWKERATEISDVTKQTAEDAVDAFAEGQDSHSPSEAYKSKAGDAIDGLLLGIEENKQSFIDTVRTLAEEGVLAFEEGFNFENSTLNTSFDALKVLIESVTEALGIGTEGTVGGLLGALEQLSNFSFNEDSIIKQFNNLKTAVDEVTSAISGGGESASSEGQGGGSANGGESGGKGSQGSGGSNSLTGAITEMGDTANEVIGEPDAEGDGTVIGEFGSLKTAVNDVASAIGSGDSEGKEGSEKEGESTLIDSITDLGTTTEKILGESGGDGVIGRFEQFKQPIQEADEHVHSISDGLAAIDGTTVECTIKINIESDGVPAYASGTALGAMNLNSAEYNAKYTGKAHVSGTANVAGNWGVRNPGQSLVGELGQELWVHSADGTFETVGDNGPEFINTAKGDLIFNHLQTKELLDKGNIVKTGKAYANGTVKYSDGTIIRPDGEVIYLLQPGDKTYDMLQKFNTYMESIDNNVEKLSSHITYEHSKQMNEVANQITNSSVVNKNQPSINIGDINVTCPGVTEKQVAQHLGNVIGKELDKQFSGFHSYVDQQSRIK